MHYSFNQHQPAFEIAIDGCNSMSSRYNIRLTGFPTMGNPKGSTITIPFNRGETSHFILSGTEEMFASSNLAAADWMRKTLPAIGNRSLRRICMPMSHDAGMSVDNTPTAFAKPRVTVTQTKSIAEQLNLGARYFDIRPVWSQGQYYTGHYSNLPVIDWQGGLGQSVSEIVKELNTFTKHHAELVILELTHDYNIDKGWIAFDQSTWDGLFGLLSTIDNLYVAPVDTGDLSQLTLNSYIGEGNAAILVIANMDPKTNIPGQYLGNGIYGKARFPTTGSYADTNDVDKMISDQMKKMASNKRSPDDQVFMLSWTLTQSAEQAILENPSILELAADARPSLFQKVIPGCTQSSFPNLIEVDDFAAKDYAALCVAINGLFGDPDSQLAAAATERRSLGAIAARSAADRKRDRDSLVKRSKTGDKIKKWIQTKEGEFKEWT